VSLQWHGSYDPDGRIVTWRCELGGLMDHVLMREIQLMCSPHQDPTQSLPHRKRDDILQVLRGRHGSKAIYGYKLLRTSPIKVFYCFYSQTSELTSSAQSGTRCRYPAISQIIHIIQLPNAQTYLGVTITRKLPHGSYEKIWG